MYIQPAIGIRSSTYPPRPYKWTSRPFVERHESAARRKARLYLFIAKEQLDDTATIQVVTVKGYRTSALLSSYISLLNQEQTNDWLAA